MRPNTDYTSDFYTIGIVTGCRSRSGSIPAAGLINIRERSSHFVGLARSSPRKWTASTTVTVLGDREVNLAREGRTQLEACRRLAVAIGLTLYGEDFDALQACLDRETASA